jgi:hypothetical protein
MHEIASGSIKSIEAPIASRIINDLVLNAVLTYHQLPHKPLKEVGISYLRDPHFLRPLYTPVEVDRKSQAFLLDSGLKKDRSPLLLH